MKQQHKQQRKLRKRFHNQVVVVTGAASGIGRALALQLDALGAKLALVDYNSEGLSLVNDETGHRHLTEVLDVGDRKAFFQFASRVERELGTANIVINNAGVAVSDSFETLKKSDFDWLMKINFWGVVNGSQAFLPQLQRSQSPALVNVSSVFGIIGVPGFTAYNASKFAVRGLTETLRAELLSSGIAVHTVHPGGVKTGIASNARIASLPGSLPNTADLGDAFHRLCMTTPEQASQTILEGIAKKRARILIGADARLFDLMARIAPESHGKLLAFATEKLLAGAQRKAKPAVKKQTADINEFIAEEA